MIRGIISITMIFVFGCPCFGSEISTEQAIVDSSFHKFKSDLMLSQWIEQLRPGLRDDLYSFLKKKIETSGKMTAKAPKIYRRSAKAFAFEQNGTMVSFEVESLLEGKFLLNNHAIAFGLQDSAESLWSKVQAALPPTAGQAGIVDFVLPEAHAVLPVLVFAVLAASVIVFCTNEFACANVESRITECTTKQIEFDHLEGRSVTENDLRKARNMVNALEATRESLRQSGALCGSAVERLNLCLNNLLLAGKRALGADLSTSSQAPIAPAAAGAGQ